MIRLEAVWQVRLVRAWGSPHKNWVRLAKRQRAPAARRKLVTEKGRDLLFVRIVVVPQITNWLWPQVTPAFSLCRGFARRPSPPGVGIAFVAVQRHQPLQDL